LSVIFCLRIFILGLVMNIKLLSFPIHRLSVGIRVIVLLGHKFFVCYNTSSSSLKSLFFLSFSLFRPGICSRVFCFTWYFHYGIFPGYLLPAFFIFSIPSSGYFLPGFFISFWYFSPGIIYILFFIIIISCYSSIRPLFCHCIYVCGFVA
jgi:hypothetical protein